MKDERTRKWASRKCLLQLSLPYYHSRHEDHNYTNPYENITVVSRRNPVHPYNSNYIAFLFKILAGSFNRLSDEDIIRTFDLVCKIHFQHIQQSVTLFYRTWMLSTTKTQAFFSGDLILEQFFHVSKYSAAISTSFARISPLQIFNVPHRPKTFWIERVRVDYTLEAIQQYSKVKLE